MFCAKSAFRNLLLDPEMSETKNKNWVDIILAAIENAMRADETLSGYKETLKTALLEECNTFLFTVNQISY